MPDLLPSRRDVLFTLPLLAGSLAACAPARRLRLLMLGGTNFVGPHLVAAALSRGHTVTLFNRGQTNAHLFPALERLRGNRYPDRGPGLSALGTTRTWDAVLDTWQAAPGCVESTASLLAGRVGAYLYVSSIATYRDFREPGMTEAAPMIDAADAITSFDDALGYRTRKRAGEQAVERTFRDRGILLRCTSIHGRWFGRPEAPGYWHTRFTSGKPVLTPDDPTAVVQWIDATNLAAFSILALEQRLGGAFNIVGPEEPAPWNAYMDAWSAATDHRSPLVRVTPEFLLDHGVRPFEDLPRWIPGDDPEPGFYRLSPARARQHGLTYRPLATTLRDELQSDWSAAPSSPPSGLERERERELIRAWSEGGEVRSSNFRLRTQVVADGDVDS